MKRVWKPLDVGGLRLYQVKRTYTWKPDNTRHTDISIVAAKTPKSAAEIIRRLYADSDKENPYLMAIIYTGYALDVFMPESWWTEGIPDERYS